jgi:anti-anti-sigma factor
LGGQQEGVRSKELTGLLAPCHLQPSAEGLAVAPGFSTTARDLPDLHVVALHGELDVISADGLVDALVNVAGSRLVVDLSGLTFMDSSGIAALVVARNRILANEQGQLELSRPEGIVRKALEIVGLSEWIVEWSPDRDE